MVEFFTATKVESYNRAIFIHELIHSPGISGAVTSIAPCPAAMVSTALDRFARIHSVPAPPHNVGERQERKAEVLEKCYLNSTPTVVVWDQCNIKQSLKRQAEGEEDEIWDELENITDT